MRRSKTMALTLAALLVGACGGGGTEDLGCTGDARAGIGVVLRDAVTTAPIEGATLTLREGDYVETLWELSPGEYSGALERAGVYGLTLEAEGYESDSREDIVVTTDGCHVDFVIEDTSCGSLGRGFCGE